MPMTDTFSRVEVISGVARRRRFSPEQKVAIVAETLQAGMSISYVARRHGLAPSLVFRWRRLMNEGGHEAVRADDTVVAAADLKRAEERIRDLERMLAARPWKAEILKEALELTRAKKRSRSRALRLRALRCEDGRRYDRRCALECH